MSLRAKNKLLKGPIAYMAGNPVAANLIMLFLLLGGLFTLGIIKQEVFPDVSMDTVTISMAYPGASPEEVEQGIVLAIEEAVSGLDDIKEINSTANEGVGVITVEILEGSNLDKLAQDINNEIDRIRTFPEDAEDPIISIARHRRQVIDLAIFGDVSETSLRGIVEQVRDRLLQDPDITQVDLSGARNYEIAIEISMENLRRYNLTISDVARKLKAASIELPGGGLDTPTGEILVRMKERRDYGKEFALTSIISLADGSDVLLEDIATITDGLAEGGSTARYNGKPAIKLDVFRVADQTPLQVSGAVTRILPEIRSILPEGVDVEIRNDRSKIYRDRINLLLRNGALGLLLVLIILGVFLELRLAFWVMMGIPISFMGSFIFLPVMDASINMVSLFAFIIALGIVVDDAIVIGENIYHHHQAGNRLSRAAVIGAREMSAPVTFSILTNIVAFLPIYFIPGTTGKIFKFIPVVVVTAFIISLFESLYVLPAHLGHHRAKKRYGIWKKIYDAQQRFGDAFASWVRKKYAPWLGKVLRYRYVTMIIALCVLVVAISYAASGRMGFTMFPRVESDFARASISLPYGTPLEKTEKIMDQVYRGALKVVDECGSPELVVGIWAQVGRAGDHSTDITVYLADPEIRDSIMGTQEFTKKWRKAVGQIHGAERVRFESDFGGPGSGRALSLELSHRDIDVLERASAELALELENFPMTKDIVDGYDLGKRQIDFTMRPEGKSLSLTASEIARQLRDAFYGREVLRQQRGRNEVKVMVRLPLEQRNSEYYLEEFLIRTNTGKDVPLSEIVNAQQARAYTSIERRNGRRVVQVKADIVPRDRANTVINALVADKLPQLMEKYPGLTWSFEGRQADMKESMSSLFRGFALAMLGIYALLAIPFRNYIQPLIVMTSIPFGIIGALIGHIIMGYSLSVISIMGIVALSGVVVNDSLILIDYANRIRRKDASLSAREASLIAAVQRFRPIVLTTLTTFFGLTPMMFERSMQARFLIPMAISLGWGILFATLITLILVPCLYLVMEDIVRAIRDIGKALRKIRGLSPEPEWIDVEAGKDL
ncbi:efflux RND transporter permease subunit [bacterium]|nr:efflux RND transporter permease subunit [bacterium]